jgi:hypothetical protein
MNGREKNTANMGFVAGGRTCLTEVLCFMASSVLADNFVLLNPPDRKATAVGSKATATMRNICKVADCYDLQY